MSNFKKMFFSGVSLGLMVVVATGVRWNVEAQLKPSVAYAASIFNFGGPIEQVQICDCTDNVWLKIGQPVKAEVLVMFGVSKIYKYGQILRTGPNALGTYRPGGSCRYHLPHCNNSKNADGTVIVIGTSQ